MSKRGVFWGLGGLLSVALVTLGLLLITATGTSAQGSVEPQVTSLPTGEASYHALARTPGVEQGLPLISPLFQLGDPPTVSLDPLPERITEGDDLTVTARLNRAVDFDVILSLEVHGLNWRKYTLAPAVVTIPNGKLTAIFTLGVMDDARYDGNESVGLILNLVSPSVGVSVGEEPREFMLVDNEPEVSLDPLPEQITEGDDLTVTARLNRAVDFDVTVRLGVYGDVNSSDYTLSQPMATISAGDLLTTFTISTIDDDAVEGNESVYLNLSIVSSEFRVDVEGGGRGEIKLVDNEPTVSLDPLPEQITEGEDLAVTARLNRAVDFTVTVRLDVEGDYRSSFDQDDYTLSQPVATISAGELFTTFTINTIDDDAVEGDEFVDLNLSVVSPEFDVVVEEGHGDFRLVDNEPEVSLDPLPPQITEGEALAVTARLNRVADFDITVHLEVWVDGCPLDDPYCGPPNLKLSRSMATISTGDRFTTFIINALDDDVYEGYKNVDLFLSVVSPEVEVGVGRDFGELTLVDNEPEVSLDPLSPRITEGDDLTVTARLNRVADVTVTVRLEVQEYYSNFDQDDYTLSQPMATIPAGELFTTFTISTLDDDVYEGDEDVRLYLSIVSPERVVGVGERQREFTLEDNEPEVSLDPLPLRITEGEAQTVTARLDRVADSDVTVRLEVDGISSLDYTLSRSVATIPAGELFTTFTINTIDDDVYERDEHARLNLSIVSPERIVGVGEGQRDFRLLDNEPELSFDPLPAHITEGEVLTVTARLDRMVDFDVTVRLEVGGISSLDYTLLQPMATILTGELFTTFTISTLDDDAYEGDERVWLFLSIVSPERIVGVGEGFRDFRLLDNEPVVSLDPLPAQITEGEVLVVTARLDREVEFDVTVRLEVDSGFDCPYYDPYCRSGQSDFDQDDYTLSPSVATIPAGDLFTTFTINTIDDDVYEMDERVRLDLRLVGPERIIGVGEGRRDFRLSDNEPEVSLDPLPGYVAEGESLTVVVSLMSRFRRTDVDVTVRLEASFCGEYYDPFDPFCQVPSNLEISPSEATIPAGEDLTTFTINTIDDDAYEGDRDVYVHLRVVSPEFSVGIEGRGFESFMLLDNEPELSLDPLQPQLANGITEGEALIVTARLDRVADYTVTVRLEVDSGFVCPYYDPYCRGGGRSDFDQDDYTLSPSVATIPAGELFTTFTISTIDDDVYEEEESARVRLSVVRPGFSVGVGRNEDSFTLLDNEPELSLDPLQPQLAGGITEGESLVVTARLDRVADFTITVRLDVEGDYRSNFDQRDYTLSSSMAKTISPSVASVATIPAGELFATFTINTIDDDVYEEDESARVRLRLVSPEFKVGVGRGEDRFTLLDNEPVVSLDPLPEQITEGEALTVTARLDRVADFPVMVRLDVEGTYYSDFDQDDDYTLSRSMATIPAGELLTTFILSTIDNDAHEDDKRVNLYLRLVSPELKVGVDDERANLTVLDNEPEVSLDPLPEQITEGDALTVTVRLDRVADVDVMVRLEVTGDYFSDFDQDDYTLSPLTATIPAGDLFTTFTISAIDDDVYEEDEHVNVRLILVSPELKIGLGGRREDNFTVLDGEPVVSLDPIPQGLREITEGEDLAVTARLDRVADFTVTVRLEVRNSSVDQDDYTLSPSEATIPAGEQFTTFTINTIDDDIHENNERVNLYLSVVRPESSVGVARSYDDRFTLLDNEPVVSLDSIPRVLQEVTEGEAQAVTARLNRVADFTVTVRLEIEANYGLKFDQDDYTLSPTVATIPAGERFTTFTINTIDDNVVEDRKDVNVRLILVSPERKVGVGSSRVAFTVLDNEPEVSLDPLPRRITEGEALTVEARLSHMATVDITVALDVLDNNNNFCDPYYDPSCQPVDQNFVDTDDFRLSPLQSVIRAGELTTTFIFSTVDDSSYEGDELVSLSLRVIGENAGVRDGVREFVLEDNEPVVSLDPVTPQITEGESLTVVARLDRVATSDIAVSLEVEIYGRIGSPDYIISPPMATIPAGDLFTTFILNTVDDEIAEVDEFGLLFLNGVSEGGRAFTVKDNDTATIRFESVAPVNEGEARMITVRLNRPFGSDLRFYPPEKIGGDAENGDYDLDSFQYDGNLGDILVIPSGDLTADFTFNARNDDIDEGPETVILRLSTIDDVNIEIENTVEVTIVDGDQPPQRPVVSLDPVPSQVREGETLIVTARLNRVAMVDVDVNINVNPPSYSARCPSGSRYSNCISDLGDYMLSPQQSTIMAGDLTTTFTFSVADNGSYENPETWELRLGLVSPSSDVVQGNRERTFSLVDSGGQEGATRVSLDPARPQVTEGEELPITVHLGRELESAVWVMPSLNIAGNSGGFGGVRSNDFLSQCEIVDAGESTVALTLSPPDDNTYEGPQQGSVNLDLYETRDDCRFQYYYNVLSTITSDDYVTIVDNDPAPLKISLDPLSPRITEGEDLTITGHLIRSGGFDVDGTISTRPAFSSDLEPGEYTLAPEMFTIQVGGLSTPTFTFTISALDDDIPEGTERVRVSVDLNDFSAFDSPSVLHEFEVIVEDNEPPLITFDEIAPVREGDNRTVTVSLNRTVDVDTEVSLVTGFGGTATRGEDYTAPSTVTIPAGQTSVPYTITILNDELAEYDETVELSVIDVTSTGGETLSYHEDFRPRTSFTIINDDFIRADLAFVSSTGESGETNLEVTLSRPLPVLERVNYDVVTLTGASFEDITNYPQRSTTSVLRNLGFDFEFYGVKYNQVSIGTNGYIAFTNDLQRAGRHGDEGVDFSDGATLDRLPVIAPLWGQYDNGHFYTRAMGTGTPDARFIIQWERRELFGYSRPIDSYEFQMVLYEQDGRIEFRYQDVEDVSHINGPSIATISTVGISDGSGRYEQVSFREPVNDNTRIVFTLPPIPTIVTTDTNGDLSDSFDLPSIIAVGETSGTVTIQHTDDSNWEADSTYTARVEASGVPFIETGDTASYVVQDDDLPEVTLQYGMGKTVSVTTVIDEGDSLELIARLTNAPAGAPEAVTVNLAAGITSTLGSLDYTLPDSVTIAQGASQAKFTVSTTDDDLAESDEILLIEFNLEYGDNQIYPNSRFELSVTDSDPPPTATLSTAGLEVEEGQDASFMIQLSKMAAEDLEFNLTRIEEGSTATEGRTTTCRLCRSWYPPVSLEFPLRYLP